MESVIINSENAEISLDAFADCENLRELKLSKGCKLSQNAFMDHTALENINIDISESITGSAFNGCENLTSINGEQVFDENTGDFVPKYKDFIMKNFNLADDIGFINQYVQANVKKIVAENITDDMNDMQKIRTLHDWVCNHTSYSPSGQESHNDAAILMNDTTVCEGYSRLCNLLYHEAGLETYYVTGVNHAWNIVKIDNHYFHVDSTWDDSNDEVNYKWFCKSDSEMKNAGGYHASWKTAVISSIHDFQENISPECNYQIGDMNTDNEINIADMVKLEKYILSVAENVLNRFLKVIKPERKAKEGDRKLLAHFYSCALAEIVLTWIAGGMKEDPDKMIDRIGFLMDGSIEEALSRSEKENLNEHPELKDKK